MIELRPIDRAMIRGFILFVASDIGKLGRAHVGDSRGIPRFDLASSKNCFTLKRV